MRSTRGRLREAVMLEWHNSARRDMPASLADVLAAQERIGRMGRALHGVTP